MCMFTLRLRFGHMLVPKVLPFETKKEFRVAKQFLLGR